MGELVKYISPSSFYYWEKCPLKAVFSKKYRDWQFFPKHPDADLGTVIHLFYEKKTEWIIDSQTAFENKWKELIANINETYKINELQKRYYPVQWYSKYYAVKKALLKKNILSNHTHHKSKKNIAFEKWIYNKIIGGYIDLIIFNDEKKIKSIVDFKTGEIFEKADGQFQIKEVYKMQLALYAIVIKEQQGFIPKLFIENIKGERILVEISDSYIEAIYNRAIRLKNKIDLAEKDNCVDSLANANSDNCKLCDYRTICVIYKTTLMNNVIDNMIDIHGKLIGKYPPVVDIDLTNITYRIKNLRSIDDLDIGREIFIYNLFLPDENENILYSIKSTIIEYGEN